MNLEDLVPPLELCKLIPQGEFEDSAFCWIDKGHSCVLPTDIIYPEPSPFIELRRYTIQGDEIPAPTLQEIMKKLPRTVKIDFIGEQFHIYNDVKNGYGVSNVSPVIAALTLWLKGIEK